MAERNTAELVLEIARSEIGAASGRKYIEYYNQLTGIGLPLDAWWCAAWVTWVMRHAGVPEDSVLNYKGCDTASEWFARQGRYRKAGSGYIPRPGDIIMYEWNPEDEGTSRDDGDDHTGIVEYVANGRVHTIEGNNGGACRRDWWSLSDPYISGYCVPLYNLEKEEKEMPRYDKISDMPKWAQETVKKLCDRKAVSGEDHSVDGEGRPAKLNLSEDMLRVFAICDNAGAFDKGN